MNKEIIIVSGLPRSGTSMMMKMLEAGGLEILTDNRRKADEDNPKGYYELEKVKQLDKTEDHSWLQEAGGKVVKIISQLLPKLPDDYQYKVIFMRRDMSEILASQKQMLIRRSEPTDKVSNEDLSQLFEKHLEQIQHWLDEKPNYDVIYVSYNKALKQPETTIETVNDFMDGALDTGKMRGVIDKSLHRQKA